MNIIEQLYLEYNKIDIEIAITAGLAIRHSSASCPQELVDEFTKFVNQRNDSAKSLLQLVIGFQIEILATVQETLELEQRGN